MKVLWIATLPFCLEKMLPARKRVSVRRSCSAPMFTLKGFVNQFLQESISEDGQIVVLVTTGNREHCARLAGLGNLRPFESGPQSRVVIAGRETVNSDPIPTRLVASTLP